MRSRYLLAAVLAALALGAAAGWAAQQSPQRGAPAIEAAAPLAPRTRTVALGRIEPVSEVIRINGPAGQDAARILRIEVREGDWVEEGAIIAVLDTRARLQAALAQAEATLELRRASLARTRADLDNQERTLASSVEQQTAQRDRARWDFERLQALQRSGLYRDTALIDRRLALESAEQVLRSAEFALARNRMRDREGRRLDEAAAAAEIAAAEAAAERSRADLAMTEIRAPIAGRILRRMARPGEQVGQDGIAEIGDTRVMMVRAEVFEADIALVAVGQSVRVASRGYEGALVGRVDRIGMRVNRQSVVGDDPASSLDARVVEVLVRLDEAASRRVSGLTGLQVRVMFESGAGA